MKRRSPAQFQRSAVQTAPGKKDRLTPLEWQLDRTFQGNCGSHLSDSFHARTVAGACRGSACLAEAARRLERAAPSSGDPVPTRKPKSYQPPLLTMSYKGNSLQP